MIDGEVFSLGHDIFSGKYTLIMPVFVSKFPYPLKGVSVGGTGVFVGGTGVSVGGTGVFVGGTGVFVGGTGVFMGGGTGVSEGRGCLGSSVGVGVLIWIMGRGVGVGIISYIQSLHFCSHFHFSLYPISTGSSL